MEGYLQSVSDRDPFCGIRAVSVYLDIRDITLRNIDIAYLLGNPRNIILADDLLALFNPPSIISRS